MKLQPYVQSSVAARSNKKLSFRFYGPYKVLQRIGNVAYKLDLPEGSRVHHVLLFRKIKLSLWSWLQSVQTQCLYNNRRRFWPPGKSCAVQDGWSRCWWSGVWCLNIWQLGRMKQTLPRSRFRCPQTEDSLSLKEEGMLWPTGGPVMQWLPVIVACPSTAVGDELLLITRQLRLLAI